MVALNLWASFNSTWTLYICLYNLTFIYILSQKKAENWWIDSKLDSVSFQSLSNGNFKVSLNSKYFKKMNYWVYCVKCRCICFYPLFLAGGNSIAHNESNNTTTRCKCKESKRKAWQKSWWRTTRMNSCFVCKWNTWVSPSYRSETDLKRLVLSTMKNFATSSHLILPNSNLQIVDFNYFWLRNLNLKVGFT